MKKELNKTSESAYIKIRFKDTTAERFRVFSRKVGPNHSDTMDTILDFFEKNGISPKENLGPNIKTLEAVLKKRIDFMIAVLKNIEKTEIKPIQAMLELLFQENSIEKKEHLVEKASCTTKEKQAGIGGIDPETQIRILKKKLQEQDITIQEILGNIKPKRSGFGKVQLRLEMTPGQFEKLRSNMDLKRPW